MKIFNGHIHTSFSHDSNTTLEQMYSSAGNSCLFGFAVTDHCDCEISSDGNVRLHAERSFYEAKKFQQLYKDSFTISCGIEMGEMIFAPEFAKSIINSYSWDVILGSVHAVRIQNYEMPFSVINFSLFDDKFINKYIEQYFTDLLETVETTDFDILCHLTVILRYIVYKYNRKVDIKQYYPIITEILKKTIQSGKTLEINTSGFDSGYLMPDCDILKIYKSLGGSSLSLGSDAHISKNITIGLEETAQILKSEGFDTLTYYLNRKPIEYKI